MMSSDEVPPPEGVAHAVAAHTSRITRVIPNPQRLWGRYKLLKRGD